MAGAAERTPLAGAVEHALSSADERALNDLAHAQPTGLRDRFATLLAIYRLHTAPVPALGPAARYQHHPAVATLKAGCEQAWLAELETLPVPPGVDHDPVAALRGLAARTRIPPIYEWLRTTATWPELVRFIAFEGGPDGAFDDLVAVCQLGLSASSKLELARNYWDEMGNGDPLHVHTTLFERLVAAINLPLVPLAEQPTSALARIALGGLLATNRWLQPEMLGALGLTELQAGPRCRLVLQALRRHGAPAEAAAFYAVHAEVDPRHGKDWLEKAIAPEVSAHPEWAIRVVRGALWRVAANRAFFADMARLFQIGAPDDEVAA